MNKLYFTLVALLFLTTACEKTHFVVVNPPPEVVTQPAPVTEPTDVEKLVQEENEYRTSLGYSVLSPGLSCYLYTITGGDRIQSSIAGHNTLTGITKAASFTYKGIFNQENSNVSTHLNVLPASIRNLYTNMYLLRCQGAIVVQTNGYYNFELTSDDGSLLFLDGSLLIDNDNNHAAKPVSGQKYLRRGVHSFRLDFAQSGNGNQALILKANGDFISPEFLYH